MNKWVKYTECEKSLAREINIDIAYDYSLPNNIALPPTSFRHIDTFAQMSEQNN